ncbi:hypothetical protein O9992_00040 [Vibrio lentus]|nr:hypothetical protein [Vibrio lentus]
MYRERQRASATSDGTVESYQPVDDVTEGSQTFNDDGSCYRLLQAATSMTSSCGSR